MVLVGLSLQAQTVINTVGTCKIGGNPNQNSTYNTINQSVQCGEMLDTLTGQKYKYVQTQSIGQRWVLDQFLDASPMSDTIHSSTPLVFGQPVAYSNSNLFGTDTSNITQGVVISALPNNKYFVAYGGTYTIPNHGFTIGANYFTPATAGVASTTQFSTNKQGVFSVIDANRILVYITNKVVGNTGSGSSSPNGGNFGISLDLPNSLFYGSDSLLRYVDTVCRTPVIQVGLSLGRKSHTTSYSIIDFDLKYLDSVKYDGGNNLLNTPHLIQSSNDAIVLSELQANNTNSEVSFDSVKLQFLSGIVQNTFIYYTNEDVEKLTFWFSNGQQRNGNGANGASLPPSANFKVTNGDVATLKVFDESGSEVGDYNSNSREWNLSNININYDTISEFDIEITNNCGNVINNYMYYDPVTNEIRLNSKLPINTFEHAGFDAKRNINVDTDSFFVRFNSFVSLVQSTLEKNKESIFLGVTESNGSISSSSVSLDSTQLKLKAIGDSKLIVEFDNSVMVNAKKGAPFVFANPTPVGGANDGQILPRDYGDHLSAPPATGQPFMKLYVRNPSTLETDPVWSVSTNNPADDDYTGVNEYDNNAAAKAANNNQVDILWKASGNDPNFGKGLYLTY